MSVRFSYKGQQIGEMHENGTKELKTAGRYCEENIEVVYSGGYEPIEPTLPSEYQRVEYLDFTPPVGIIIEIPTTESILYYADFMSRKNSGDHSVVFGYRLSSTSSKDFELGQRPANQNIISYVRDNEYGYGISNANPYTPNERAIVKLFLSHDMRSEAMIGRYGKYDSTSINDFCLDGRFYSLRGVDLNADAEVAWFVPCYRKSDNQVGVYDLIAGAFYYEIYYTDSSYAIAAGPDVN